MAEPIKHDTASALVTAGSSAAKWGIIGGLAAIAATALIPIGLAAGTIAGTAALWTAGHGVLAVGAAIVGGLLTLGSAPVVGAGAGVISGAGALVGLAKGGSRVSRETQAFEDRAEHLAQTKQHKRQTEMNNAAMAGMQQGYMMGFQEGQQQLVNQLQQAAMEQQMAGQKPAAAGDKPGMAEKFKPAASKVEALAKDRAAQAEQVTQR